MSERTEEAVKRASGYILEHLDARWVVTTGPTDGVVRGRGDIMFEKHDGSKWTVPFDRVEDPDALEPFHGSSDSPVGEWEMRKAVGVYIAHFGPDGEDF